MKTFLHLRKKSNNRLVGDYLQNQPKELVECNKESDFQYSDFSEEKLIFLFDITFDYQDVYSQHKFDVSETRQNFHDTPKSKAELKRQRINEEVMFHLEIKWANPLTEPKDASLSQKQGHDDEPGILFVKLVILRPENDSLQLELMLGIWSQ